MHVYMHSVRRLPTETAFYLYHWSHERNVRERRKTESQAKQSLAVLERYVNGANKK
jgi:hypothetical protein